MDKNDSYKFIFESELIEILGEDKVSVIKNCGLEEIFDALNDYYFEHRYEERKDNIIKAYDMIINAFAYWFRDELIERFSKMLYGHMASTHSYTEGDKK